MGQFMSEYEKLKEKGLGRGRPKHTDEQREQSVQTNAARQEARRRSHMVLKNRHQDEFSQIYEAELKSILSDQNMTDSQRAKKTRK